MAAKFPVSNAMCPVLPEAPSPRELSNPQGVTEGDKLHAKEPLYKLYSGSCFMQYV